MSRLEVLHAHAVLLRDRASVLASGDAEARRHACELEAEANEIDPQREQQTEDGYEPA